MKKAIIVGASSGIGAALAKKLIAAGYDVGITGRRAENLQRIKAQEPTRYCVQSFDSTLLNNDTHLEALVSKLGGLDLLIVSSGTGHLNESLDYLLEKQTIDLNVSAFTQIVAWGYAYFEKQGFGHLVGITSIAGIRGSRMAPAYNASKSYQINYLEGLRQKAAFSKNKIVLTDVRPGFVDTAMAKGDGLFWVAPAEKAAKQILNGIRAKRRVVYVTKRWRIIAFILKHLPSWIYNTI